MTDFTSPESVDLPMYDQIMHVNYTAAVSLATAFLPFLSSKKTATSLIWENALYHESHHIKASIMQ